MESQYNDGQQGHCPVVQVSDTFKHYYKVITSSESFSLDFLCSS